MEKNIQLNVEGMTCNHCAGTVRGIIQQEGGQDIHVDYLMGEAHFELENLQKIERILKRLDAAGYKSRSEGDLSTSDEAGLGSIEKKLLFTLPFSLVLFSHMFLPHDAWLNNPWVQLALALPVFATGLWHFGKSTFEGLRSGHISMDLLILLGSTSAFAYSLYGTLVHGASPEAHRYLFYETTSTIITLVLLGYTIEHRAVKKTTTVLRALYKAQPQKAKKLVQNGLNQDLVVVPITSLAAGDLILVNTGDRVPADGSLKYGPLRVDESMLTGESEQLERHAGDRVLSGSLVVDGSGALLVDKAGRESTIGQIIELVKQSRANKPRVQQLADRISAWFVPVIIALSFAAFGVNFFVLEAGTTASILRSVAILVVACPCAMGLATPTAVSVGLGLAGRLGMVVKQASVFELLAECKTFIFDKTGTLTTGRMEVVLDQIEGDISIEEVWQLTKALEMHSTHPIAQSILETTVSVAPAALEDVREMRGGGMSGRWNGQEVRLGSGAFTGVGVGESVGVGEVVGVGEQASTGDLFLTVNGKPAATFRLKDALRADAAEAVAALHAAGFQTVLLSGDREEKTREVAQALHIPTHLSRRLPEQKLEDIQRIRQQGAAVMVGDGINDGPALATADVGISMGTANSLASESARVVVLNPNLNSLPRLMRISKGVVRTIRQNLFWAFAYNVVAIPMAALGYLDPMLAALSMAFSDVIVIGNSLRLRFVLPKRIQ